MISVQGGPKEDRLNPGSHLLTQIESRLTLVLGVGYPDAIFPAVPEMKFVRLLEAISLALKRSSESDALLS
jgi:hypothetical protein